MTRQPITIVEIDFPTCIRVFGTAPCTAALSATTSRKCFNSRATCADSAHYDGTGTLTLRFAYNQTGIPGGMTIFPALESVSTRPAELNLSGIDTSMSALGKRARVTVTIGDFAYHDTLTDPYQAERVSGAAQYGGAGYQPGQRGTFWGKHLARWPYYVGLPLRVLRGYVGDSLAAMDTAHYVIAELSGPGGDGRVTITAKDVLDLADNKKAVAPALSTGKLLSAITATDTTATLTPAGIGSTYAASGLACIGREVCGFTRSGDVLTLTRGREGTAAAAHAALDTVQQCLVYADQRPCDVISDLLVTYAGVPSSYIDATAWGLENDRWLSSIRLFRVLTKPTGVAALIGEICQLGIMVWWDETARKIRFRANRPLDLDESAYPLSDAQNHLAGTIGLDRGDDMRLTAVMMFHGMIDPTQSATDANNYARAAVASVTDDPYGQDAIKIICAPWLGAAGNDAVAASISTKLKNRYKTTPNLFTATLDMKDRSGLSLGQIISVQTRLMQDDTGAIDAEPMQVSYLEIKDDRLTIKAETWAFSGRFSFIAPYGVGGYGAATEEGKRVRGYIVSAASLTFPDGTGPYILF